MEIFNMPDDTVQPLQIILFHRSLKLRPQLTQLAGVCPYQVQVPDREISNLMIAQELDPGAEGRVLQIARLAWITYICDLACDRRQQVQHLIKGSGPLRPFRTAGVLAPTVVESVGAYVVGQS